VCRYTDSDPKWLWVDPLCTFMFAISVIWVTKTLVVDIIRDLMEAVPTNIDIGSLLEKMRSVPGVSGVHDLHVWRVGTGKVILTAHVDVSSECTAPYHLIEDLEDVIGHAGIAHSTVQLCRVHTETSCPTISREPLAPVRNGSAPDSGLLTIA
jgi:cobalt-zinc-cadmium efflux system protein